MSFGSETKVKAVRKQHSCEICDQPIFVGEPALRWAGKTDGDFYSVIYHPECREAEIAFNDHHGVSWDEWMSLRYNRDSEDDAWLIASFPDVAKRLGVLALP